MFYSFKLESSTHIWKTIISLRGVAWVNETSETSPPFIEVPISNPGSEGGHIFMCWGSYILPLSTIFSIGFRNCSVSVLLLVFHFTIVI